MEGDSGHVLACDLRLDLNQGDGCHVKGVALKVSGGGLLAAAASTEGHIFVVDPRCAKHARDGIVLQKAHSAGGACDVAWRPANGSGGEHELLTTGFDTVLKLWDLRRATSSRNSSSSSSRIDSSLSPQKPLREFRGHIPPPAPNRAPPKLKNITRPRFLGATGATIAVCGDTTHHLTLFDTSTGAIISRGELDEYATTIVQVTGGCSNGGAEVGVSVAVAEASGRIKILKQHQQQRKL